MARATWVGAIQFGLVNVPVKLYTAVTNSGPKLHTVDTRNGERIHHRKVNDSGRVVPDDAIAWGYEVGDRTIVLTEDDLATIAPDRDKTAHILGFIDATEVDPILYQGAYHVGPDKRAGKPYRLLVQAMDETGLSALVRFVMRTKEHLGLLQVRGDRLVLLQVAYVEHLAEVPAIDDPATPAPDEVNLAVDLVGSMKSAFQPELHPDRYTEALEGLVEARLHGKPVPGTRALMDQLKASQPKTKARRTRKKA